jgi:hypothetical protein
MLKQKWSGACKAKGPGVSPEPLFVRISYR